MKWIFIKTTLVLIFLVLLCDVSSARRSSGGRSRSKSSGGSSWWGRRKSSSSSSSSSGHTSHDAQPKSAPAGSSPKQDVSKTKPSAPVEPKYVRKPTTQNQQLATNQQKPPIGWNVPGYQGQNQQLGTNQQKSPIGWNIPRNQNNNRKDSLPQYDSNNQKNPIWNTQSSKSNRPPNSPSKGWASGYQTQGSKHEDSFVKKETSKVQSSPHQPQPPQPGWNVGGQSSAPNANSGWKSGYQTHAAPPSYPHHNAAPPAYNGQPSWGAPPAYPGHAPSGYGGFGHGYQQPGGYGGVGHGYQQQGGYGGYGGYHPQQSVGGYNPGYGGMAMGGYGGGFGHGGGYGGGFGGGFGSPGGGYYPMKKPSFFSASTIGSVVAGMLVYNMASSLVSYGLGLKRPYTVVNYYNQEPGKKVEEIKLPSNVLTLCDSNVTQMCGQGTQSVCTQNGTVLCVATLNQASPCDQGGNQALCVNTTVPCVDANDPLCQNSTQKDKLQAEVNVPCFTNLTLDVNLVDKDKTLPNTKYTYCVTTMAVAGPDYKDCEELKHSNDYRSVLSGNYEWFLETDGFRRNYSIYTAERPMESNGEINMPITVLLKCTDDTIKLCAPGTISVCTSFNEVMCMASVTDIHDCPDKNSTCVKSDIPCPPDSKESFCENKTEGADSVSMDIPCFANITINAPIPKFNLAEFNGTLPDLTVTSSYTYHFNFCVVTLALPGSDYDLCITKEGKEKLEKGKT